MKTIKKEKKKEVHWMIKKKIKIPKKIFKIDNLLALPTIMPTNPKTEMRKRERSQKEEGKRREKREGKEKITNQRHKHQEKRKQQEIILIHLKPL